MPSPTSVCHRCEGPLQGKSVAIVSLPGAQFFFASDSDDDEYDDDDYYDGETEEEDLGPTPAQLAARLAEGQVRLATVECVVLVGACLVLAPAPFSLL